MGFLSIPSDISLPAAAWGASQHKLISGGAAIVLYISFQVLLSIENEDYLVWNSYWQLDVNFFWMLEWLRPELQMNSEGLLNCKWKPPGSLNDRQTKC